MEMFHVCRHHNPERSYELQKLERLYSGTSFIQTQNIQKPLLTELIKVAYVIQVNL